MKTYTTPKKTTEEIRSRFIQFFREKSHKYLPSASLVPPLDDQTLLLINAGMAPLKKYFLAIEDPPAPRCTSVQKVVRTVDIDQVGTTSRHLTFFEMLGNFSFGNYFKREAIYWAWEFLTFQPNPWPVDSSDDWNLAIIDSDFYPGGLGFDPRKLIVTIHELDKHSSAFWNAVVQTDPSSMQCLLETPHPNGLEKAILTQNDLEKMAAHNRHLVEDIGFTCQLPLFILGDKYNRWAAGETGPWGYNSEIYYDLGREVQVSSNEYSEEIVSKLNARNTADFDNLSKDEFLLGADANEGRFIEVWNLVFMEFNRSTDKTDSNLPKQNVDTGAGLERLAIVGNHVTNVFQTTSLNILGDFPVPSETPLAMRIADHARSVAFLLADGVNPDKEGRGYVLRRLMRKLLALEYLHAGLEDTTRLLDLFHRVQKIMGAAYPELHGENAARAEGYIKLEHRAFSEAWRRWFPELESKIKECKAQNQIIKGEFLFLLHDTYGFPFEISRDLAEEAGVEVDTERFTQLMTEQRFRARTRDKFDKGFGAEKVQIGNPPDKVEFIGYDTLEATARLLGWRDISDNRIAIYTDRTPFYAESGGQPGDIGTIKIAGETIAVLDCKQRGEHICHRPSEVLIPKLIEGIDVILKVDAAVRQSVARPHSATHLLHKALRDILGTHVAQRGSQLNPDQFRFDFSHFEHVKPEELAQVEERINRWVLENHSVNIFETDQQGAKQIGAMMIFGEKYGERVRVVSVGDVSRELCGGTHVKNSSEIGLVLLTAESSIASGIRRIEAVTGMKAYQLAQKRVALANGLARKFKTTVDEVEKKVDDLQESIKLLRSELKKAQTQPASISENSSNLLAGVAEKDGFQFLIRKVNDYDRKGLKDLCDQLMDQLSPNAVLLLGCEVEPEKLSWVSKCSDSAVKKGFSAGDLVKLAAELTGGRGGGRPQFAEAGGKDIAQIESALAAVRVKLGF